MAGTEDQKQLGHRREHKLSTALRPVCSLSLRAQAAPELTTPDTGAPVPGCCAAKEAWKAHSPCQI